MDLELDLKNLKKLHESAKTAKEELTCKVDKIVKKYADEVPYLIEFNGDFLLIKFRTRRLEPSIPYNINNECGYDGHLVPTKSNVYGLQLVYMVWLVMIVLKPFERYSDNHDELPKEPVKCNAGAYHSKNGVIEWVLKI